MKGSGGNAKRKCRHCLIYRAARKDVYYCRHYYELKPQGCYSHNIKEAKGMWLVIGKSYMG